MTQPETNLSKLSTTLSESALSAAQIKEQLTQMGKKARMASRAMAKASAQQKNLALLQMGMAIRLQTDHLKDVNQKDIERARAAGQDAAFIDRLTLSDKAILNMIEGLEQIATLTDPIGEVLNQRTRRGGKGQECRLDVRRHHAQMAGNGRAFTR